MHIDRYSYGLYGGMILAHPVESWAAAFPPVVGFACDEDAARRLIPCLKEEVSL